MKRKQRYLVITPARDEAEYLSQTIDAVAGQTVKPVEWIIVNDGSKDNTGEIAREADRKFRWIRALDRTDRGFRRPGGGVVDTFQVGYDARTVHDFDYIVKLDGDLSFSPDYFERCFEHFQSDQRLGIGGGVVYNVVNGEAQEEKQPRFHVRGATKIYRRECWEAIGGLVAVTGWDTLDEARANMLGFTTRSFSDLPVTHYRPTGSAQGTWKNAVKNGTANYITGYHPLFMLSKAFLRVRHKPYGVISLGLLYGFVSAMVRGEERVPDPELIAYVRKQQMKRLTLQPSIWR